ncbi:MAG: thrombospondin type 3 repeat-containing protein [Pseudomonadota bacterium]
MIKHRILLALALTWTASSAVAAPVSFDGEMNFCTNTCNSFGALGGETGGSANTVNSIVNAVFDLPAGPDGSFSFSDDDDVPFGMTIFSSAIPLEEPILNVPGITDCPPPDAPGQLCNATTVNPLPVVPAVATVSGFGQLDKDGVPTSGEIVITFTAAPFSNNGAVIVVDLSNATFEGSVFGGVVIFTRGEGVFANADADGDGFATSQDNCSDIANADQRDTDGDGLGNICDADLNNDCVVNVIDLGLLRSVFFSNDADADLDGDGVVNVVDLGLMRTAFFGAPGPSGLADICD